MDERTQGAWTRVETVDLHTEGEPLRVIVSGFPIPDGDTVLERRRNARAQYDTLRTALMWEPRGHADMYGCLVMPPVTADADFSVLFLHNEGFSTMCGHGIIAVTKLAVESGWLDAGTDLGDTSGLDRRLGVEGAAVEGGIGEGVRDVGIDTPAGFVRATAHLAGGGVRDVSFLNVPSFAPALDQLVDVPGIGAVRYDLAFGGAFYAFVEAEALGLRLTPDNGRALIDAGNRISEAVRSTVDLSHPEDADLEFLYGTVFHSAPHDPAHHSRHVCVFADGEVDRSPTGTAVSGRLAILHGRGEVAVDEAITIESIVGGRFMGRVESVASVGELPAVIPDVGGRAFVTGRHTFLIDPADPWSEGFLVR